MKPKFTRFHNFLGGAIIIAATCSLTNHAQAAVGDVVDCHL